MGNSVVREFFRKQDILSDADIVRGLYLIMDCTELFVFECEELNNKRKTYVFEYGCGQFDSCRTETNTMEKYLMDIPNADYAEYVNF